MLGGLYQSVLRAELTHRLGVDWRPIVNGQAEIAGVPDELLAVFSKRTADIDVALADKLDDFRQREGREPSRWERAALTREASADTRSRKSGNGAADLTTRWQTEAADAGWTVDLLDASIDEAAAAPPHRSDPLIVADVVDAVSQQRSSWTRADVLQAICDRATPRVAAIGTRAGRPRWSGPPTTSSPSSSTSTRPATPPAAGRMAGRCGSSRPHPGSRPRRSSPRRKRSSRGRWPPKPTRPHRPPPSTGDGLDPLQADAAAAVAGDDRLVLVVGPAGAGKTRMLTAAADDLHASTAVSCSRWRRPRRRPGRSSATPASRPTRSPSCSTMATAPTGHRCPSSSCRPARRWWSTRPACCPPPPSTSSSRSPTRNGWRLALVGDPRQLQGVGRGGLLAELCANGRVEQLERLHRFTHAWEAAASLQLRSGDPRALDAYEAHGRIVAGTLDDHLDRLAATWIDHHDTGRSIAVVASTNDHVDTINQAIQTARLAAGHLDANVGDTDRRRRDRPRRRCRRDPPQRPPPRHQQR